MLGTLGLCIVNVHWCCNSNGFLNGPKQAPFKLSATSRLGARPEVIDRCPIRLLKSPANDTCHRHIFKTLHSTVWRVQRSQVLEHPLITCSSSLVFEKFVHSLSNKCISTISNSLLWNRRKTLTEVAGSTYVTAAVSGTKYSGELATSDLMVILRIRSGG